MSHLSKQLNRARVCPLAELPPHVILIERLPPAEADLAQAGEVPGTQADTQGLDDLGVTAPIIKRVTHPVTASIVSRAFFDTSYPINPDQV